MAQEMAGYLLHADPNWVQFHLANSVGKGFAYTRGAGAPMRNLVRGGLGAFITRKVRPHEVPFIGRFVEYNRMPAREAWDQYRSSLGAPSWDTWSRELEHIRLTANSEVSVLAFENLQVPPSTVRLVDLGMRIAPQAVRGRALTNDEVNRLLEIFSAGSAEPRQPTDYVDAFELDTGDYSAEGRQYMAWHMRTERNAALVADCKKAWAKRDPLLRCEVCSQSLQQLYGERGIGYIEAHHKTRLGSLNGPVVPTADDLAPVCPNCHRMLHRRPELTINALRNEMRTAQAKARSMSSS